MTKSGSHHHAGHQPAARGMKRHHKLLVVVAVLLALGWLAWNVLLVESDVAGVAVDAGSSAPPAAR